MSAIEITRTMWCERCAKAHRPHKDSQFIVKGQTGYHLYVVDRFVPHNERGFTPHLVSLYKLLDEKTVVIVRSCAMLDCGVSLKSEGESYTLKYNHVSYENISLADWNSLVTRKDLGYKI